MEDGKDYREVKKEVKGEAVVAITVKDLGLFKSGMSVLLDEFGRQEFGADGRFSIQGLKGAIMGLVDSLQSGRISQSVLDRRQQAPAVKEGA